MRVFDDKRLSAVKLEYYYLSWNHQMYSGNDVFVIFFFFFYFYLYQNFSQIQPYRNNK